MKGKILIIVAGVGLAIGAAMHLSSAGDTPMCPLGKAIHGK